MVLATMVVKWAMVVMLKTAMTYLATCQFTETWRMHLQELPPIPFVLFLLRISVFTASICMFDFSYFSAISFIDLWASFWHWNYCNRWVFYWVSDNSTSWISSAFLSFSCKIMTMTFFVKTTKWVSDRVIALSFVIIMAIFCKIGESNNDFFKLWGWFNK